MPGLIRIIRKDHDCMILKHKGGSVVLGCKYVLVTTLGCCAMIGHCQIDGIEDKFVSLG